MTLLSVIEISSTAVEMILCQKTKNGLEILENIQEEMNLLKGVRKSKKISFEKWQKLCDVLKKMKKLSADYKVEKIITIASSSLRNIENLPYLLDQIKLQVDLDVEVPTVYGKKKLRLKSFLKLEEEMIEKKGNTLLFNLGSITSDFFLFNNRKLLLSQIMPAGVHKFLDVLDEENLSPKDIYMFIEEYISNYLEEFKKGMPRRKIQNISFIGEIRSTMFQNIFGEIAEVNSAESEKLYGMLERLEEISFNEMSKKYGGSTLNITMAYISLCLLTVVCRYFEAKGIRIFPYDLKEIIAEEYFYPEKEIVLEEQMWKLTVDSARDLGIKYDYDKEHADFTLKVSKMFYEALKNYHAMDIRFERYLELASILHDIGKNINLKDHAKHSAYLIENSFLFGLTEKDLEAVSLLAASHNYELERNDFLENGIYQEDFVNFMKLSAILRLVTALDRSKKQKVKEIELSIEGSTLNVAVETSDKFLIESYSFNEQIEFFKKVFGLNIKLSLNWRYNGNEI